jgi:hypothetical protein
MFYTNFQQTQLCLPHSNQQRLFSASLAIGISLFFLAQLHSDFLKISLPTASQEARIMLLSFPTKKSAPKIILHASVTTTPIALKRQKSRPRLLTAPSTTPIVEHSTKNNSDEKPTRELVNIFPENQPSTKPVDPLSGTARFKYDSATIRQAYEASKSDIQKLAEKSGASLEDPKSSKHDRFQQAANRAAKPDCLRQGGSILSLFVVAYQVATDHCK